MLLILSLLLLSACDYTKTYTIKESERRCTAMCDEINLKPSSYNTLGDCSCYDPSRDVVDGDLIYSGCVDLQVSEFSLPQCDG